MHFIHSPTWTLRLQGYGDQRDQRDRPSPRERTPPLATILPRPYHIHVMRGSVVCSQTLPVFESTSLYTYKSEFFRPRELVVQSFETPTPTRSSPLGAFSPCGPSDIGSWGWRVCIQNFFPLRKLRLSSGDDTFSERLESLSGCVYCWEMEEMIESWSWSATTTELFPHPRRARGGGG